MEFDLKEARRRSRLTQGELAYRSGISLRQVKAIENGEVKAPHPHTLRQLLATLRPADPCLLHCRSTAGDDWVFAYPSQAEALRAAIEFISACCETEFRHSGEEGRLFELEKLLAKSQWPQAIRYFDDWTDASVNIESSPTLGSSV